MSNATATNRSFSFSIANGNAVRLENGCTFTDVIRTKTGHTFTGVDVFGVRREFDGRYVVGVKTAHQLATYGWSR